MEEVDKNIDFKKIIFYNTMENEEKRVVIYERIKRASGWCELVSEVCELAFGVIG